MADSMKQFIARKLKENVPLSEIKKDLQEKGYTIEQVNKAVQEAIGGFGKRLTTVTIFQLSVIVVGVVIAVGAGVYFTGDKGGEEIQTINTISPSDPCKDYQKIPNELSCQEAITIALTKYPGDVSAVDRYVVNTMKGLKDAWLILVKLDTPLTIRTVSLNLIEVIIDPKSKEVLGFFGA